MKDLKERLLNEGSNVKLNYREYGVAVDIENWQSEYDDCDVLLISFDKQRIMFTTSKSYNDPSSTLSKQKPNLHKIGDVFVDEEHGWVAVKVK